MRTALFALIWITASLAAPVPEREPDSSKGRGDIIIDPPLEEWSLLTSSAFFSKPTTLLEHRDIAKLRGILSSRVNALQKNQVFSERRRLEEICKNVPLSYLATKTHTMVKAKISSKGVAHCHIQVRDDEGLMIEQLLFVSKHAQKDRTYVTQTITFFYPLADEERASAVVSHFLAFVRRGDG